MTTTVHTRAKSATVRIGASNTKQASKLHESRLFSRPEFNGFGQDAVIRKDTGQACYWLLTSRPLIDQCKSVSGLSVQQGTETMKTTTPISGNTTGTSAQITPTTGQSLADKDRIALATAALAKAQSELKNGRYGPALGQTLKASRQLKQLCADSTVGGRHE